MNPLAGVVASLGKKQVGSGGGDSLRHSWRLPHRWQESNNLDSTVPIASQRTQQAESVRGDRIVERNSTE
ncbi:hypothetical protein NG791_23035 [Laspinema sp. D1]|uniref:hypothetical protein n=1 Tax=Laspinema palackyanum TaxID=3231601 RepID=UPI00346980F8|nr:hypothetical protein [Laspinema sp. D2b]